MKISEAAREGGVTVPTFKYYLREGLVHEGTRLSSNQTEYTPSHVQRVRLVRALLETGGLSIGTAKAVLATLNSGQTSLAVTFETAQHALAARTPALTPPSPESRLAIDELVAAQGWHSTGENPGTDAAARVLDGLAAIDFVPPSEYLEAYASAAALIARADLGALITRERPDLVAELMVVGTVLGDSLIAGLRRLAQESVTSEFFPTPGIPEPGTPATEQEAGDTK
ncbi:MAG: MerR family transcriptional regulator [Leifsonia flava]